MDDSRYGRNVALFGEKGQQRIADTSVAIVGLGGLGSHVAQQLAYLGTQRYALVDADIVSESSLNRLIGAVPGDVAQRTSKARCAERMVGTIQPDAQVEVVEEEVRRGSNRASAVVAGSGAVFGCLDAETPRLLLTELCSSVGVPYFDLATDTGGKDEGWYGGRVVSFTGVGCLSCLDLLDQNLMRYEQMSEADRAASRRLYGLESEFLGETGPAVVSVNGVVASLAVTEFMAHVTGIRPPALQLTFRGDLSRIVPSRDTGREGCPYCSAWQVNVRSVG